MGVHVRQGDALDLKNGFFNYEPSAHDDAYVALFAAEMRALCSTCAAAGQRALFFLASDQARCSGFDPSPNPGPNPHPHPHPHPHPSSY